MCAVGCAEPGEGGAGELAGEVSLLLHPFGKNEGQQGLKVRLRSETELQTELDREASRQLGAHQR